MTPHPIKPVLPLAAAEKLDLRVGTILGCVDVKRSSKLVQLDVDFGDHRRCVLVGMKGERADPGEVVGRQALFLLNVPPRRICGIVSTAMLFDIGAVDGIAPVLAVPERPVPNGARAG